MATVGGWLHHAAATLKSIGISTSRLDAEIILAHTLHRSRTYLHAHIDDALDARLLEIANARLDLRTDRVPVAYIIGHKEFYGRLFKVTTATLIPRPESEAMIDLLKELHQPTLGLSTDNLHLVDIGTGSGCLGITAKLELPELTVTLVDVSQHALTVASRNAALLHADVTILRSDLLSSYPFSPNIILANLPYVDAAWETPPELEHEPSEALFADDHGLKLIKKLLRQSILRLTDTGKLFLEADVRQHDAIDHYAAEQGLTRITQRGLIVVYERS